MTSRREKVRSLVFLALGVAGLLLSRHLPDTWGSFGRDHGANLSFSFGAFFLMRLFPFLQRRAAAWSALAAWSGVTLVEMLQRSGHYPGTFDVLDLVWNTAGVLLGWGVHALMRATSAGSRP